MSTRERGGFTLIELLIVVAIIGTLAAMAIPNLIDAVAKAKQKRTVADIQIHGTSLMAWLADNAGAAAAGSNQVDMASYTAISPLDLEAELVPTYLPTVSRRDGWKFLYEYYLDTLDLTRDQIMAIRAPSRDGVFSGSTYSGGPFDPTDYNQDIVWTDGFFVRWPQRTT